MPLSVYKLAALALLISLPAAAQQYRWTDDKGRVQYSDTPPPSSAKNVQKKELKRNPIESPAAAELARAAKSFPITLYTSPPCKQGCAAVRDALNKRGVPFKEVQVWDQASNDELKKVSGGNGVPVLLVGANVSKGFEQGAFDKLLDDAGYPKAGALPAGKQAPPPTPPGPGEVEPVKPVATEPAAQK